jgi:hypothetical protein
MFTMRYWRSLAGLRGCSAAGCVGHRLQRMPVERVMELTGRLRELDLF